MNHLFSNQTDRSCDLTVPNGLKELMNDISREVLRFRPDNVYSFIADFLASLLVTREHLTITSHVCACIADKDISESLLEIGLDDEEISAALRIISENFNKPKVEERIILIKLAKSVKISLPQIDYVQDIIRTAYLKHSKIKSDIIGKLTSVSSEDEMQTAINHTLALYKQTKPAEEKYNEMAKRIKFAYNAYGVKRDVEDICVTFNSSLKEQNSQTDDLSSNHYLNSSSTFLFKNVSSMDASNRTSSNGTTSSENSLNDSLKSLSYEDFYKLIASVEQNISKAKELEKPSQNMEPKNKLMPVDGYYADDDNYDLDYY